VESIRTDRLELIPATLAHVDADLQSPEALGQLLGAAIPASWPPGEYDRSAMEFFRARLSESGDAVGWYGWYAVHGSGPAHGRVVIGSGGFLGPPDTDGVVEIGYSVAPEFRKLGFATELVQGLVLRALSMPQVVRLIAHTTASNPESIRVLEKCGFTLVVPVHATDIMEYERSRPTT
jgi:ribosomal-protein-alanine N-acetyltransferase